MKQVKKVTKKSFWKQLKERWTATSPKFWKTIEKWAISIGGSAVAVLGVDKMFDLQSLYGIHPLVFTICGYVIVFCAAVGLSAKITKVNTKEEEDEA